METRSRLLITLLTVVFAGILIWPNIGERTVQVHFLPGQSTEEIKQNAKVIEDYVTKQYQYQSSLKTNQEGATYLEIQGTFVQTAFLNELSRFKGVDSGMVFIEPIWIEKKLKAYPFKLGLDLQGGMNLVLEADFDALKKSLEDRYPESYIEDLKNKISTEKDKNKKDGYKFELERIEDSLNFTEAKKEEYVRGALEIIRSRIDRTGVSEPMIRMQGTDRIEISLPGVASPERAKKVISSTARVEYHLAEATNEYTMKAAAFFEEYANLKSEAQRKEKLKEISEEIKLPPELRLYVYWDRVSRESKDLEPTHFLALEKRTVLDGNDFSPNTYVGMDPDTLQNTVNFQLSAQGTKKFGDLTSENVGRFIAIVIDNRVRSNAQIRSPILSGSAQISGSFTQQEAADLALIIKEGALPIPMRIVEERSVGPSLGKESINNGVLTLAVGLALVVIYILLYYHVAGVVATLGLFLNLLFMAGILAWMKFTVTLPGLAGIVLTMGMAVDANVIIYERIKEEMRDGKTLKAATAIGFDRATWTVFDANLTTLLAAIVLSQFGVGPVKGFAVTLLIGILTTLFTTLYINRTLIYLFVYDLNWRFFSFGFPNFLKGKVYFPFMKLKWISLAGSVILAIALFVFSYEQYGGMKQGIDFAGGIRIDADLPKDISIAKLRDAVKELGIVASVQSSEKGSNALAKIEIGAEEEARLEQLTLQENVDAHNVSVPTAVDYFRLALNEHFQKNGIEEKVVFDSVSQVGPTIGKYLRESAVKLMIIVIILITIYVAFRFELRYAIGALGATIHDVVMIFAFIAFLQVPLSIPVIAAVLTIIGYSINDTIVIFDRIRENMANSAAKSDYVVDLSINETLVRTFNTSITTLVTVIGLYFWGGEGLSDMALVLIVGIAIGTYSSTFIASPVVVIWERFFPVKGR